MRIAVGVGSRGIAHIAEVAEAVIREFKRRGAAPFIIPAMGSHGGGTPEGQVALLADYGVTPERMGVPFEPSMETVEIGRLPGGQPLYFSREALNADAVFAVNRVKPHTDFHGPLESGLSKMLVIGYGKHRGAAAFHAQGFDRFHEGIPAALQLILERVPVLGGLALLENGYKEIARLEVVRGADLPAREPELAEESRRLLPLIPFKHLDVLAVDYVGKNISGSGMDPNVTGRYTVRHIADPERNPKKIVALRLTEETHGNACGLGLADLTTRAVVENIDYQAFWTNIITSTELNGGKTPIWTPSDREAIALALLTCNRTEILAPRLVRIRSTLHLEEMWVSEALWQAEGAGRADLEPLTEPMAMAFTPEGNLADLPLPAFRHGRRAWEDDETGNREGD